MQSGTKSRVAEVCNAKSRLPIVCNYLYVVKELTDLI